MIIPAYNEGQRIERAIQVTKSSLNTIASFAEIIIAEDGSKDETNEIVRHLARSDPNLRLLSSKERLGKGRALDNAIREAKGQVVCFIDADLATNMIHLIEIIEAIRIEGYDIVTGSRLIPGSESNRYKRRLIASLAYNGMVRFILGSKVHDHQCGFKAFKKESVLKLLDEVQDCYWFWDTEVLVRGQRRGYKIKEIPIRWNESEYTKVDILRVGFNMFLRVAWLWWDLKRNGH